MATKKTTNIAKVKPTKRKVGRPKVKVSGTEVRKLAELGLNNSEIADFYGVNETTLRNNYSVFLAKGRMFLKNKLRRKQISVAMKGNVIMLIWLGKQLLSQTDKVENKTENKLIVERRLKKFETET